MEQIADHDPPRHHGQIGRQAALTAEVAQQGIVALDDRQEDLGTQVVAILGAEADAAGLGRVVDDVDHQANEAIDEVVPRPGLLLKATFQQVAIDLGKTHAIIPFQTYDSKLDWEKKQAWSPRYGGPNPSCGVDSRAVCPYDFS